MYNWIAAEQTADEDSVVITDHDLGCQDEEEEGRETRFSARARYPSHHYTGEQPKYKPRKNNG